MHMTSSCSEAAFGGYETEGEVANQQALATETTSKSSSTLHGLCLL